jgi:ribosomal protein L22
LPLPETLEVILLKKIKERDNHGSSSKIKNVPTSPRKMRLVAGLVRGKSVNKALGILKFDSKSGAARIEKLLLSAVANWQAEKS